MGALRCDVCFSEDGPVSSSPQLPTLLNEHLGIKAVEGVTSCNACSQLLNLWDEFSREARSNLGGSPPPPVSDVTDTVTVLHKSMESQTEELAADLSANFTRHFQGICEMCNTTFKNLDCFNDHLNCMHSQHNFILFTNNHIIEDSNQNKTQIVEFKKRSSVYNKRYSCVYMCNNCNKSFNCKQKLEHHMNTEHHSDHSFNPFHQQKTCDICMNDPGKNIFEHLMETHIEHNDTKLKCPFCENLYDTKDDIECHIDNLHFKIKMKFKCNLPCKKVVSSKKQLDYHVAKIHSHKKSPCLLCDYCSKKFARKFSLRNHIVRKHLRVTETKPVTPDSTLLTVRPTIRPSTPSTPSNASCSLCRKIFKSVAQLNMHMKTMHTSSSKSDVSLDSTLQFTCGICQKCFVEDSELSSHISKEHQSTLSVNNLKRKNNSEVLSEVNDSKVIKMQNNYKLVDRYDYYEDDGAFYCNYCHKITALEMAIKLHLKKFHKIDTPVKKSEEKIVADPPAEEENQSESMNNISSTSNSVEVNNISSTSDSLEVKCNLCEDILANSADFIEHLKTHVRNKGMVPLFTPKSPVEVNTNTVVTLDKICIPISCSKCNEKFSSQDEVTSHEIDCSNYASEFMCKLCSKSFTTELGLNVHNQVHTGMEVVSKVASSKFECEICGKVLASKHGLHLHKKYTHINKQQSGGNNFMGESSKTTAVESRSSIFVCKFCDQSLPNEGEFKQHLINHVKRL